MITPSFRALSIFMWPAFVLAALLALPVLVVAQTGGDQFPPRIVLVPYPGATVSGEVSITAEVTDDNGVASVEFFVNDVSVGTDATSPYSVPWNTRTLQNGAHRVSVTARDVAGKSATESLTVRVNNVLAPLPNAPAGSVWSVGTRVMATANVNVRSAAGLLQTLIGTQQQGAQGTIVGGPLVAEGITWWRIDYDQLYDGWSAENYLGLPTPSAPLPPPPAGVPDPTPPPPPPPAPAPAPSSCQWVAEAPEPILACLLNFSFTPNPPACTSANAGEIYSYVDRCSMYSLICQCQTPPPPAPPPAPAWRPQAGTPKPTAACPAGEAATGVRFYEWAFAIDDESVEIGCASLPAGMTLSGTPAPVVPNNAMEAFTGYKTALCPTGSVLTGSYFYAMPRMVDDEHVEAFCTPATGLALGTSAWVDPTNALTRLEGGWKTAVCPAGSVGVGLRMYTQPVEVDDEHVSILCASTGTTPAPAPAPAPTARFQLGDVVQVIGNLNVRQSPATNAQLLGTQPVGTRGTIVGGPITADGYTWWKINYDSGADGWSIEPYLAPTPSAAPAPAPTARFQLGDVVRTTDNLNVRANPSLSGALLGTRPVGSRGVIVGGPIVADGFTWWEVNYDIGLTGWSVEPYLALELARIPTPVTPPVVVPGDSTSTPVKPDTEAPTIPSSVTGLYQASAAAATLGWIASTDNVAVAGYDIYRDGVKITTVNASVFVDFAPRPGATHLYAIQAFDAAGNKSAMSAGASVAIPLTAATLKTGERVNTTALANAYESVIPCAAPPSGGGGGGGGGTRTMLMNVLYAVTTMTADTSTSNFCSSGILLGTQPLGAQGTIVEGPITSGGVIWWKVNYDSGVDGWTAGPLLVPQIPPRSDETWSAKELLQALRNAERTGLPLETLLSEKINEELKSSGLKLIDEQLKFVLKIPASTMNLSSGGCGADKECVGLVDFLKSVSGASAGLGSCSAPIPEGTLYNARTGESNVSAKFLTPGTSLNFTTTPEKTTITLALDAEISAGMDFGFEWCGHVLWPYQCTQWIRNPACPPPFPVCRPDPKWYDPGRVKCDLEYPPCPLPDICALPIPDPRVAQEPWTEWTTANISGRLAGSVTLALNHTFTVTPEGTVRVGATADLSGRVTNTPAVFFSPVRPDLRLIPTPLGSIPHVDKTPILQSLVNKINVPLILMQGVGYDEKLIGDFFESMLEQQEQRLNQTLAAEPIEFKLPSFNPSDPNAQALAQYQLDFLRNELGIVGEFVMDIISQRFPEILYYILTDNREAIKQMFTAEQVCPVVEKLKAAMPAQSMYTMNTAGVCSAVDPRTTQSGLYYSDASCKRSMYFQSGEFQHFCRDMLRLPNPNPALGNAAAWSAIGVEPDPLFASILPSPSTKWSLAAGAQLGIGVEAITRNNIPYMKRVHYRTANGCALEMRVYKKNVDATNQKPLLWIHGGSWTFRGPYIGLESLVSSYTEEGFVVFAPFYRLADNTDGSPECRNATWTDFTSDVEAALAWVKANSAAFGAPHTGKIPVIGQSAGAHLSAWLVTKRPADVSRAMLIYPPADFSDFLRRMNGIGGASFSPIVSGTGTTPYLWKEAAEIVESAFQVASATQMSLTSPVVLQNSFGAIVRAGGVGNYPPVFILHGGGDVLLHYTQAEALCNGYGGSASVNWTTNMNLRSVFRCGTSSYLHLFREADHAFELCLPLYCRSGSLSSAALVAESLKMGRRWLLDEQFVPMP